MLIRALLLLLLLPFSCLATEFRVCGDYRNVPPLIYTQGLGAAQYFMLKAAENLQLKLTLDYHPQPRCIHEVAQGHYDALLVSTPSHAVNDVAVFPAGPLGQLDTSRAYLLMRVVAFKIKGNPADWDGQQFSHLTLPVLFESGVPVVQMLMNKLSVPSRASAKTPVHMIGMMRLGRADIAIGLEPAIAYALKDNDPQEQFVILSPPLLETPVFLAMGKRVMARNPMLAEQIWDEIKRLREGPEWQKISAQVLNNQLTPTAAGLKPAIQPAEQGK
ncbi:MAG: hypothetical protein Q8R10_14665 [Pseudomonas sp.]|uniref:hypothetical protein n=1 Tax=Pseudomonas sp. TaxID=306 RepID=UPI0027355788|nr:hypothetical protein [Pseudomonas sp.]MDP3847658.1 hypothetical protein [Pseudomonas sp.]